MILADYSIAFVLLSIGGLTVLITMLVCMVKMSREMEDINDSMSSVARTLHNLRRDVTEIDANAVRDIENRSFNSQSDSRPRTPSPRVSETRSSYRRPKRQQRPQSNEAWRSRADEVHAEPIFDDWSEDVPEQLEVAEDPVDLVVNDNFEPESDDLEIASAKDESSGPPPAPKPSPAVTSFLDAAAAGKPKPSKDEDDIVVDDGDDREIVYI
jgi:hypothetical protein